MNILDLTGRTALITGAGQGVGRQAALHLAAYGAKVVVNDYFEARAKAVAEEINAEFPGQAFALACDVSDYEAVQAMATAAAAALGPVDVLVNNAGNAGPTSAGLTGKPFWEQDPAEWDSWIDVNFRGVLNTSRAFIPQMIAAGKGSIINVISDAGRVGEANLEVYSGAKAGAAGFTRGIARTLGRFGVRANCVAISGTRTPTTEAAFANPDFEKKALAKYLIRRWGEPTDVANMILVLASDATSWVTGQTYPVNGGFDLAV